MMQTTTNEILMTQRVALGGMQTERDNADHHIGPTRGAARRKIEMDEEITVIPVESVLSIKYTSEIKKGLTESRHVVVDKPAPVQRTCCERIGGWCKRTFCCCCNNSDQKIHPGPEKVVTTISNEQAERKILVTIEHIRYSNIHTPSHIRVLQTSDQFGFFKENLHTDILKFYLLDNCDFEQENFNFKQMQASTLCRLVTQLKSMIGHYPDESTLKQIIGKEATLVIGDAPQETIEQLTGPGQINRTSLNMTVPYLAIQDRQ